MSQAGIEDQIYRQETTYLEETSAAGNIVRGFDSYIKASSNATASAGTISGSAIGGGLGGRRKAAVNEADRVFSRSSVSYMRDSDSPSSSTSTPNHAATPTGSFTAEKTGDKKKKKSTATAEDDTENKAEGRATKRQKISFGAGRKSTHDD
jgi:chromatin modification-related protein EAF6